MNVLNATNLSIFFNGQNGRFSLVAQMVTCLPTLQETQVRSLGGKDLLEKEMATYSSILAWKIPWTEERGTLVCGVTKVSDTT